MGLEETKMLIGQRIARIRQSQGFSQRNFSSMIELDRVTLNRIESGVGNPTVETLQRIADGLEVDVAKFFSAALDDDKATL